MQPNDPQPMAGLPPPPTDRAEDLPLSVIPHDPALYSGAPPAAPRTPNGGCRGCATVIAGMVGCLAVLAVAAVALIVLFPVAIGGALSNIAGSLGANVPPPAANVISTQTIVTGIQPLGQLVSVSSQLAIADVQVSIAQGAFNACGFNANHVVQGAVEAGIDLTRIDEGDLRYDAARDLYVLTIPAPQVTSCRIDYIRQYERSFTTCAVDWDEARLLANYLTLINFRDTAIEGGILRRAESETTLILGNFVRLLTGRQVEIVFEQPALSTAEPDPAYPPSCAPPVPSGWVQNDSGQWVKWE
ncbi:MAG: DUF4230 domain-containing protein [bacterium]|nr:DUF4230 domain-containing protein [bacterium]